MTTPSFTDMLTWIDDRSAALRTAFAAAADPGVPVPGCPDWSLRDLVAHLGEVQRFWAAAVAAGPSDKPVEDEAVEGATPSGDLSAWSRESTATLLAALEAAGPDAGCWAWWGASGMPLTAGAVARHQVQEAAVHAWDAQQAAGAAQPLPTAMAVDAVDEFLRVSPGAMGPWPNSPARLAVHIDEGSSWLLDLSADGTRVTSATPPSGSAEAPDTSQDSASAAGIAEAAEPEAGTRISGPAGDVLLALYGRLPLGALRIDGDRTPVERLLAWLPLG